MRAANDELKAANVQLAARNDDLQALFHFAGGLAARAHDRGALTAYAEEALTRLTGGTPRRSISASGAGDIDLVAGGARIGSLHIDETPQLEGERWNRLRGAILPQLATAIESAGAHRRGPEEARRDDRAPWRARWRRRTTTRAATRSASPASPSRWPQRLGYEGVELDAIEIGALLHDIGKIGIPERILHKPGPLDDDEWKVMKEHPVISEYILQEVDLDPIVLQIARSSHERMDGKGYPDGLPATRSRCRRGSCSSRTPSTR